jgi:peptidoglycan/LPS O-acetylase OafA/YrhL
VGIIRIFLALVVAYDHLNVWVLAPAGLHLSGHPKLGMSGPTAVMFFYVISGYLISLVLSTQYGPTSEGTRHFYAARFIRIFSLYWPLYAMVMTLNIWRARETIAGPLDVVTGVTLLGSDWSIAFLSYPNLHFQALPSALAVAWTLGAELAFYLLAPFLLRSTPASAIVLVLSFAVRVAIAQLIGFSNSWSYMFFPGTICFFLLGHFARLAYERLSIPPVLGSRTASKSSGRPVISMPRCCSSLWRSPALPRVRRGMDGSRASATCRTPFTWFIRRFYTWPSCNRERPARG